MEEHPNNVKDMVHHRRPCHQYRAGAKASPHIVYFRAYAAWSHMGGVGKQATRFIVWCSFCGHLAANTAPEQKRHPISFILEHTPRGTH